MPKKEVEKLKRKSQK